MFCLHPLQVREVSDQIVHFSPRQLKMDQQRSFMFMQWGQFIDYDLDFSLDTPARVTFRFLFPCLPTYLAQAPLDNMLMVLGHYQDLAVAPMGQLCLVSSTSALKDLLVVCVSFGLSYLSTCPIRCSMSSPASPGLSSVRTTQEPWPNAGAR